MEMVQSLQLQQNEQALVRDSLRPEATEYKFGPCVVHLEDPWQEFGAKEEVKILDQDDFIIIREADGTKRRVQGAAVYRPAYGEEIVSPRTPHICKNPGHRNINCPAKGDRSG